MIKNFDQRKVESVVENSTSRQQPNVNFNFLSIPGTRRNSTVTVRYRIIAYQENILSQRTCARNLLPRESHFPSKRPFTHSTHIVKRSTRFPFLIPRILLPHLYYKTISRPTVKCNKGKQNSFRFESSLPSSANRQPTTYLHMNIPVKPLVHTHTHTLTHTSVRNVSTVKHENNYGAEEKRGAEKGREKNTSLPSG